MEDYQIRVINESYELKEKIEKLDIFYRSNKFDSLDDINQNLLIRQLEYMQGYLEILIERIELF